MTDSTIRMLYRDAKDKHEMLYVILPQLTLKSPTRLKQILNLVDESEKDSLYAEIEQIKKYYNFSDKYFAKKFRMSEEDVKDIREKYNIPYKNNSKKKSWNSEEIEKLCKAYNCNIDNKTIASLLDRTYNSVTNKIYELKVSGVLI